MWKWKDHQYGNWGANQYESERDHQMKVRRLSILKWWSPLLPRSSIWKWGDHQYVSGGKIINITMTEGIFMKDQRSSIWKRWLSKSYSKIINKKVKRSIFMKPRRSSIWKCSWIWRRTLWFREESLVILDLSSNCIKRNVPRDVRDRI